MTASHVETERTFELPTGTPLPDLSLDGAVVRAKPRRFSLRATYYDTEDLVLARAQVTLRRREGGDDDGWHLKLPLGQDRRRELHRPLGRASVPVPLRRALIPLTMGAVLRPIVEVRTSRTVHLLSDPDGNPLAEVAEDDVSVVRHAVAGSAAMSAEPGGAAEWQEVEIELLRGDDDLLEQLSSRLGNAGAWVSDHQSKLRRALGDAVPARHVPPKGLRKGSAGGALWRYLAAQTERLVDREVGVRLGVEDSVHQMRITARRLRSALAVCRPLLDEQTARHLEAELRWLGQQLSEVRDLEVMQERLLAAIAADKFAASTRGMASAVRTTLRRSQREAVTTAQVALDSPRRAALQASLESLLADPPFTGGGKALQTAAKVLDKRITRSWRRFAARVATADEEQGPAHDEALHNVRKAAKRLRYAAELASPTLGKPADKLRSRAQEVQKALGDYQDSIVARAWYERLGREATSTAAAFGFGRLHAREQSAAGTYVAAYGEAVDKVRTASRLR